MKSTILRAAIVAALCVVGANGYAKGSCDNLADKQKKLQCLNEELRDLQEKQKKQQAAEQRAQQAAQRKAEQRTRQDQQRQQEEAQHRAVQKAEQEKQRQQQQAAEQKTRQNTQQAAQLKAQQERQRQTEEAHRQAQQEQQRQQQQMAQQRQQQAAQLKAQQEQQRRNEDAQRQAQLKAQQERRQQQAAEQRTQHEVQQRADQRAKQEQQRQQEDAQRRAVKAQQDQQRQQQYTAQKTQQPLVAPVPQQSRLGRCDSITDSQQKLQCLQQDLRALQEKQEKQLALEAGPRQQQQLAQQESPSLMVPNQEHSKSGQCDSIAEKHKKLQCLNQKSLDLQETQKTRPIAEQRGQQKVQEEERLKSQLEQKEETQRQAQLKAQQDQQRQQQKTQQLASPNQPSSQSGRCNSISDPQQKLLCIRKGLQAQQAQPQVSSQQIGTTAMSLAAKSGQLASPLEKYANGAALHGGASVEDAVIGQGTRTTNLCGSSVSKYLVPDFVCFDAQGERKPYADCDGGRGNGTLVRYKVDFSAECMQHDICYGMAGVTKSQCDAALYGQLKSSCRTQLPRELGERATLRCYETALLFNDVVRGQATKRFGIWMIQQVPFTGKSACDAFVSAQKAKGTGNSSCN